jgi:hypothetical protein
MNNHPEFLVLPFFQFLLYQWVGGGFVQGRLLVQVVGLGQRWFDSGQAYQNWQKYTFSDGSNKNFVNHIMN